MKIHHVLLLLAAALLALGAASASPATGDPDTSGVANIQYRFVDNAGQGWQPAPSVYFDWEPISDDTIADPGGLPTEAPGTCATGLGGCDRVGVLDRYEYTTAVSGDNGCKRFGFRFTYYGAQYDCAWINGAGWILLGDSTDTPFTAPATPTQAEAWGVSDVPGVDFPNGPVIAMSWAQIIPNHCALDDGDADGTADGNAGIWFKQVPESAPGAGDATWIVEWIGQYILDPQQQSTDCAVVNANPSTTSRATFQGVLQQDDGSIVVSVLSTRLPSVPVVGCPTSGVGSPAVATCTQSVGIESASDSELGVSYAAANLTGFTSRIVRFFPDQTPGTADDLIGNARLSDGVTDPTEILSDSDDIFLEDAATTAILVLSNDKDVDNDWLQLTTVSPIGTAQGSANVATSPTTLPATPKTASSNNIITYRPTTNACNTKTSLGIPADAWTYGEKEASPLTPAMLATTTGRLELTLTCVNDVPQFSVPAAATYASGQDLEDPVVGTVVLNGFASGIRPGPTPPSSVPYAFDEETDQTLSLVVSLVDPADAALFAQAPTFSSITSVNGKPPFTANLQYTPAKDACKTTPIQLSIVLKDNGGTANGGVDTALAQGSQLTMRCVNDEPRFTLGPDVVRPIEPGSYASAWATAISPGGGPDEATQGLSFSLSLATGSSIFAVQPAISPIGELTFKTNGSCGFAIVRILLKDTGGVVPAPGDDTFGDASPPKRFKISIDCALDAQDDERYIEAGSYAVPFNVLANDVPVGYVTITDPGSLAAIDGDLDTSSAGTTGDYLYTPPPVAVADMPRIVSFSYKIQDDFGRADTATVRLIITNKDLVAGDDRYSLSEDGSLTVSAAAGVRSNDLAAGFTSVAANLATPPIHGNVRFLADGAFEYTPDTDFHGLDRFTYYLTGEKAGLGHTSEGATAFLDVRSINDAPVATADAYTARPGKLMRVNADRGLLHNDFDADGDILNAILVAPPLHGTIELDASGGFVYRPNDGFTGEDVVNYQAGENASTPPQLLSNEASVRITVQPNSEPVADFAPVKEFIAAGKPMTFIDRSYDPDGAITAWDWDFGDGEQHQSEQNPSHVFVRAGEFTVTLRVLDRDGFVSTKTLVFKVTDQAGANGVTCDPTSPTCFEGGDYLGDLPIAIAGDDRSVPEGSSVHLDGSGGDGASALAWHWVQVEGPTVTILEANSMTPSFNAPQVGFGEAVALAFELTIFDGHYTSLPDRVDILVTDLAFSGTVPQVTILGEHDATYGSQVQLRAQVQGFPGTVSYEWRQVSGPSVGVMGVGPELTFRAPAQPGSILVKVTATSQTLVREATFQVDLRSASLAGFAFEKGDDEQAGLVAFQALHTEERSYLWEFGDGETSNLKDPVHAFATTGTYTVKLTVERADGSKETQSESVNVFVPVAQKSAGKDSPGLGFGLAVFALAGLVAMMRRRSS